jgi:hypothetical protein
VQIAQEINGPFRAVVNLNSVGGDNFSPPTGRFCRRRLPSKLVSRYDGVAFVFGEFLLHLFRVKELMARRISWIEPGHESWRLGGTTLGESERTMTGCLRALSITGEDSRVQHGPICIEDTHLVMLVNVFRQNEPVGSRGQDAPRNLNGLAKGNFGGLIRLICPSSRQNDQECKQQSEYGKVSNDSNFFHRSSFFVMRLSALFRLVSSFQTAVPLAIFPQTHNSFRRFKWIRNKEKR